MVLVYAGRRIDLDDTASPKRFPQGNIPRVASAIRRVLGDLTPSTVVGSAACGADLLVLEAAGRLGVRRRIILPFDRATFRTSSVTDRPGKWGTRFDAVVREVSAQNDLVELTLDPNDDATYLQTNFAILRDAESLAGATGEDCRALVVWNGAPRGSGDVTEAFLKEADRRGWSTEVIDSAS